VAQERRSKNSGGTKGRLGCNSQKPKIQGNPQEKSLFSLRLVDIFTVYYFLLPTQREQLPVSALVIRTLFE
jgi:hypothetical protein